MKKILLLVLFVSLNSFAQTSFFVDKKGTKTFVKDSEWDIIVIDKRVSYRLPGKTWEKYIKFEDLDYGIFGPHKIKSYIIDKKKKVLFVHAEADGKTLVSLAITTVTTHGSMSSASTYYQVYVLGNNDEVLAKLDFKDHRSDKATDARGQLSGMIKSHFAQCTEMIAALDAADTKDEFNTDILDFLHAPIYRDCK